MVTRLPTLAAVALLAACITLPEDPESLGPIGQADVRVLFVGNSLTTSNNLPAMVGRIASAGGKSFEYRTVVGPNMSLEDHWRSGVESKIRDARADFVVMQQGPSSVGSNPLHLKVWGEALEASIRESGGRPALLMVWPEQTRMNAFDDVRDSYGNAALAIDGAFIPAGEAWRKVWEIDPEAALYGGDGFHPSMDGTFVAAVAVYAVLFNADPRDLPDMDMPSETAATYYQGVWNALTETLAVASVPARGRRHALIGTDSGIDLTEPGVSIHEEPGEFVAAGLTPYRALLGATHGAARFLASEGRFGSVAPGLRADLLLLDGNPLEDVRFVRRPRGVMLRGAWRPFQDQRTPGQLAELSSGPLTVQKPYRIGREGKGEGAVRESEPSEVSGSRPPPPSSRSANSHR